MEFVTEKARGKINLYLDVTGKRDDGYHNILSVMHTVELFDTITISKRSSGIEMSCSDPLLSCGEDNLCVKAAKAFFEAVEYKAGCDIHLEKRLPMGAGMGGGSADAAAVLRALNELYEADLSSTKLCTIGARIGADVPFCVKGGCQRAEGIGEILNNLPTLPKCHIVVCEGGQKVSTPQAYRLIDTTPPTKSGNFDGLTTALKNGSLKDICLSLYNRFEDTYPECAKEKAMLTDCGALGALMTGSGSAVFGIFDSERKAELAKATAEAHGINAWLC